MGIYSEKTIIEKHTCTPMFITGDLDNKTKQNKVGVVNSEHSLTWEVPKRTEKLDPGSRNNFFNFHCKRESGNLVFAKRNVDPKVKFFIRKNNTIFVSHGNQPIESERIIVGVTSFCP